MRARRPTISVLLPVRNGLPWLASALESIFSQTLADFELIVLEDGSTDGTEDLVAHLADPRVKVVPTGGVGIARALNTGLAAATGAYVARHDADDESVPDRLERQVAFLEANRDIDLVATVAEYIDGDGRVVSNTWVDTVRRQQDVALTPDAIAALMPLTCCVTHGSIVARRGVLLGARGYDADMVPAEDFDLWLRLLPTYRFAKLPERLYRHRLHDGQTGMRRRDEQTKKAVLAKLRYLRRVCPDLPLAATLAVVGSTRGDEYYREMAPHAGFRTVDGGDRWDVLVVTDFSTIDQRYRELCARPGTAASALTLIGNCFVSRPRVVMRRTA